MPRLGAMENIQSPGETEFGDNIYERVGISLYNTIRRDPSAAVRSLVAPDTLSPDERKRLHSSFVEGRTGPEKAILGMLTNPIVLIGAALSVRWPVLNPSTYRAAAAVAAQYSRWIPPGLRGLLGLNEVFVGTPIPSIVGKISVTADNFIHKYFAPVGEGIERWRKVVGRNETVADQVRWALQSDNTFGREETFRYWNAKIREINDRLPDASKLRPISSSDINVPVQPHDELVAAPWRSAGEAIMKAFKSDKEGLKRATRFMQKHYGMAPEVRWVLDGYFPRLATRDIKQLTKIRQDLIESMLSDTPTNEMAVIDRIDRFAKAAVEVKTGRLMRRDLGLLVPDADDLSLLPKGAVSEDALKSLAAIRDDFLRRGKPGSYSLKFSPAVSSYAHSMGRTYAWAFTGLGDELIAQTRLVQEAERATGLGFAKTELLRRTFIPQVLGVPTFDQAMKASEWSGIRQLAYKYVNDPKAMPNVPVQVKGAMRKFLEEDGFWSPQAAGAKVANFFYNTTLGLNLSSSGLNLLQPILTTAGVTGLRNVLNAQAAAIERIPQYARLRRAGKSEIEALQELFPDFVASGGEVGALAIEEGLTESAHLARSGLVGAKRFSGKLRDFLLAPFRNTELFNRLVAFEAGKLHAAEFGLVGQEAAEHATNVVNITQLWAGGASLPSLFSNWNPVFRQYLSFPSKLLAFGAGSIAPTVTAGGLQFGIGGPFNPGTLGRAMLYSAGAYEAAKELADADISYGLLFGGLPVPRESGVLSPLPFVPPVISLGASAVQDLVSGSTENIRRSLPLLVPGGVAAARAAQGFSPTISKLIGRPYADLEQSKDGLVPYFTPDGKLIGYRTRFDLLMSNFGVPGKLLGPNGEADVRDVQRYLAGQRDQIRTLRAGMIDAYLDNEPLQLEAAQRRYLEDYGVPPEIRPQDVLAAKRARMIPRLERLVKTLPVDVRQRFLHVISTSISHAGTEFLGVDPALLGLGGKELTQVMEQQ